MLGERDGAALDVGGETRVERLGDDGELVAAVGRAREARDRGRLEHGLREAHERVRDLDLDARVQLAQVAQHAVEVQLARPEQRVLAALLLLCHAQQVRLADLPQPVQHLRQLRRVQRLQRNLAHRLRPKRQRPKHLRSLIFVIVLVVNIVTVPASSCEMSSKVVVVAEGGGARDGLVDALEEHEHARCGHRNCSC